ncbi:NAD(P)/FAD-dependent oxidoreductase [bacterium]|nr:NAD(P)/FAD-dependent oxidoreductase [bacterium]
MKKIQSFRIPYSKEPHLTPLVADFLGIPPSQIEQIRILKRSLDARSRQLHWEYSLEVYFKGEKVEEIIYPFKKVSFKGDPPLIIGAGPAGLFAAWTFLKHGITPVLLEQGDRTHERMRKISLYWRKGVLDTASNVCNGEGGAGTFSDGKLITRIKSPLIPHVMQALVEYGAPAEITYAYNPHVGSNLIREVIRRMSDDLIKQGGDLRFNTAVLGLELTDKAVTGVKLSNGKTVKGTGLVLACGHSAGSFFKTLKEQGVFFEPKSFALGLRIEHPQQYINQWQYGEASVDETAQYKLTSYWDQEKVGVYSFCMCPGGYVISSTTDPGTIVVNGMSNYHRNSPFANAAIVCSVDTARVEGDDPFKMMGFQREIEKNVFNLSDGRKIPAQRLEDFLNGKKGAIGASSCPSGVVAADLSQVLPGWIYNYLSKAFLDFEKRRPGFLYGDAMLHAVESRTSSPVRITRNPDTFESVSTQGLFPCGEGPGYAGGITSAAVDGIKAALAWITKFCNN